jgi:hypothetical protein
VEEAPASALPFPARIATCTLHRPPLHAALTTTMAANGILSPPSLLSAPTVPFIAKRKHAASTSSTSNGALPAQGHYTLQMVLEDMLAVLKRYDASAIRA